MIATVVLEVLLINVGNEFSLQLLATMFLTSGCMVVRIKYYGENDLLKQSNAIARYQPF